MHINTPRESEIQFNAGQECYQARVTVRDMKGFYLYAVQVPGHVTAEPRLIKAALVETARQMHLAPARGMHSHQITPVTQGSPALAA